MSISLSLAGTGWSGEYHAFSSSLCPEITLKGVFSPSLEEAREFSRRHHIPLFYNDMEYLLDYSSPDIVTVATPTNCHLGDVEYIAERGVSIILESPMANTKIEADRIVEVAEREGIYLFPVCSFSSDPVFKALSKAMDSGFFGSSPTFHAFWSFPSPLERMKRNGGKAEPFDALLESGGEAFHILRLLFPSLGLLGAEKSESGIDVIYREGKLFLREGKNGFSITVKGRGMEAKYSSGTLFIDNNLIGKAVFPRQLSFLGEWYRDMMETLEKGTWSSENLVKAAESVGDAEKVISYVGNNCLVL